MRARLIGGFVLLALLVPGAAVAGKEVPGRPALANTTIPMFPPVALEQPDGRLVVLGSTADCRGRSTTCGAARLICSGCRTAGSS